MSGCSVVWLVCPESTTTSQLLDLLGQLNADPDVHGILVQLPLPKHVDAQAVLDAVTPLKDVDAFAPENVGLLSQGRPRFLPCTPHGVAQIFARYDIETQGKHVVVVGRSDNRRQTDGVDAHATRFRTGTTLCQCDRNRVP